MTSQAESFNKVAELYDRIRPGYPETVFTALRNHAKLNPNSHILEVGCGTGQATRDLVQITRHITGVEPGANLLAVAQRNMPDLTYANEKFEDFETADKFNLIISATAWHWVDPNIGYRKVAKFLKPDGYFANLRNYHIETDPGAFLNRADAIFKRYSDSSSLKPTDLSSRHQIDGAIDSITEHGFRLAYKFEQPWRQTYSIDDYIALRRTYSPHLTMVKEKRLSLERELRGLAAKEFDGKVTQSYLAVLLLAQPI